MTTATSDPTREISDQPVVDGRTFAENFPGPLRSVAAAELADAQQALRHAQDAVASAQAGVQDSLCDHVNLDYVRHEGVQDIVCVDCSLEVGSWVITVDQVAIPTFRVACNVDPLWRPTLVEGVWMNHDGTRWASISRVTGRWIAQDALGVHLASAPSLESLPSD